MIAFSPLWKYASTAGLALEPKATVGIVPRPTIDSREIKWLQIPRLNNVMPILVQPFGARVGLLWRVSTRKRNSADPAIARSSLARIRSAPTQGEQFKGAKLHLTSRYWNLA